MAEETTAEETVVEEVEAQEPPPDAEEAEEVIEPIESLIIEDEDGPTTRKVQTEFTIPTSGPEAVAMGVGGKGAVKPKAPPFQPCGDMPLPPGADPGQWGFPEFCPRKMTRYAEAAAAAAAEADDPEAAMPGEAVDTILEDEMGEATEEEMAAKAEADGVKLSVLSEDATLGPLGEEAEVFEDAMGAQEEWSSEEDVAGSGGIKVDIKVDMPKGIPDAGSVGFQAPAAAEEDAGPQQEEAPDEGQPAEEEALVDSQPAEEGAPTDMANGIEPVLWKIEQEIAVVRTKLSEMQQKITALDIADVSGGMKPAGAPGPRKKCVCDARKKAALPAPAVPATPMPTMAPGGYHSAPVLQQYQRQSFTNMATFPQQFPQTGGGVDIYIASRSGNTNAVTSINPANFQQYAEKPVLKAFTSPDVDVYVVTDKANQPGYSGQN